MSLSHKVSYQTLYTVGVAEYPWRVHRGMVEVVAECSEKALCQEVLGLSESIPILTMSVRRRDNR